MAKGTADDGTSDDGTAVDWRREWPHWLMIAGMFALAAFAWTRVPERVPVHWDVEGNPDRFGGRAEGLLLIPCLTAGLYALLLLLPRIDPGQANYRSFRGAYGWIRFALTAFLAGLFAVTTAETMGVPVAGARLAMPLTGVLLVVIGNQIGRVRPNWFVGARTPWTLSSKRSWDKSNRLCGRVLVVGGGLFIAAGVIGGRVAPWLAIGFTALGSLAVVPYSYLVYREDPDRVPPAGVSPAE